MRTRRRPGTRCLAPGQVHRLDTWCMEVPWKGTFQDKGIRLISKRLCVLVRQFHVHLTVCTIIRYTGRYRPCLIGVLLERAWVQLEGCALIIAMDQGRTAHDQSRRLILVHQGRGQRAHTFYRARKAYAQHALHGRGREKRNEKKRSGGGKKAPMSPSLVLKEMHKTRREQRVFFFILLP